MRLAHGLAHGLALCLALVAAALVAAQAQDGGLLTQPAPPRKQAVTYLFPEQVTIAAGKPVPIELHFRVAAGLHINSHTPSTSDLIPTTLTLAEGSPVRFADQSFPRGDDFAFPVTPSEKLSVYTGDFTVRVELLAASAGEHLVEASLRYQACDNNACMPPHTVPVVFDVIAR